MLEVVMDRDRQSEIDEVEETRTYDTRSGTHGHKRMVGDRLPLASLL
jgi:hypothetical protein